MNPKRAEGLSQERLAINAHRIAKFRNLWPMSDTDYALKMLGELGELAEEIRLKRVVAKEADGKPIGIASELADLWMIAQGYLMEVKGYPYIVHSRLRYDFFSLTSRVYNLLEFAESNGTAEKVESATNGVIVGVVGYSFQSGIELWSAIAIKTEYNQRMATKERLNQSRF